MTARHPRRWLILIVLCLSTLVLVLDNGVLTVAIPSLTEDLGVAVAVLGSAVLAFVLLRDRKSSASTDSAAELTSVH
jgi:MFS transporter, DHA2 family, multidrug resistance protein